MCGICECVWWECEGVCVGYVNVPGENVRVCGVRYVSVPGGSVRVCVWDM